MIRLLLVDDQSLICEGLKAVLEVQPDLQVVGTASTGEMAIEQVAALQPDLVLMDVQMPMMNGVMATRVICDRFPDVKVLVLSTFDDTQYVEEAIEAGAKSYLLKVMPTEELVQTIRLANQGYFHLAPGLLNKLKQNSWSFNRAKFDAPEFAAVTKRERQVLQLLVEGATNREIAERLFISEGTVKTHVKHLFERLGCDNRTQLARRVLNS